MIATKRSSLLAECLFWGADSVALMITGETNPMHLRPQDRSIREEEMTAEEGTLPLEDALEVAFLGRLPEDLQLPLLFRTEEQPAPNPCESLMDFECRFSKICGPAAEAIMRVPSIVFAGGAVLSAFLGEGSFTPRPQTKKGLTALVTVDVRERVILSDKNSDVDAFVISHDVTEGERSLRLLFKALQGAQGEHRLLVVRSNSAVTIFRENEPTVPIQLVLHVYTSISCLLASFDVDCCAIAYSPTAKKVWCTRRLRLLVGVPCFSPRRPEACSIT